MDLIDLLTFYKLDMTKKIKLVRHQDKRDNLQDIYSNDLSSFEFYQQYQERDVFTCDYIISFLGLDNQRSKFIGIYKVLGKNSVNTPITILNQRISHLIQNAKYHYDLKKVNIMDDLTDRLIVNWGEGTRAWHQWLISKEIIEILPTGYCKDFKGFDDVILTYKELKKIVDYPDASREWHEMLSSIFAIYLILDTTTGMQYIGSAYGQDGLLGRWRQYAQTGHGDNKILKSLLDNDSEGYKHFQYSILRALPKTLHKNEVLQYERLYKNKLGTKAFGLNLN